MIRSFIEGYRFSKAVKLFKTGNYEPSLKIFSDLSKKSAMSNYYLGIAYAYGYGCEVNFLVSNKYFKRSYELQNKTAAFHVAYTYEKSNNWTMAEEWYINNVTNDEPRKYFRLAKLYKEKKIPEPEPGKIESLLEMGVSIEDPAAMYLLAEFYIDNKINLDKTELLLTKSVSMGLDRASDLLKSLKGQK